MLNLYGFYSIIVVSWLGFTSCYIGCPSIAEFFKEAPTEVRLRLKIVTFVINVSNRNIKVIYLLRINNRSIVLRINTVYSIE